MADDYAAQNAIDTWLRDKEKFSKPGAGADRGGALGSQYQEGQSECRWRIHGAAFADPSVPRPTAKCKHSRPALPQSAS